MLSTFTVDELTKWNAIVKEYERYDVYYLANYTKAFKVHGDGEPILFHYEDRNVKAINVTMKRDIAHDKKFKNKLPTNTFYDLATPYGYGGLLIEGSKTTTTLHALAAEYNSFCAREGIVSEFVRFHPVLRNAEDAKSLYDVLELGKTITVPLTSPHDIWNSLSSNKKRWVKKAREAGVEVYLGREPALFEEFKRMYEQTMTKNNAQDYYFFREAFYQSVLQELRDHSLIFYAVYKNRKVAMVLALYGNGQIHHHLSASNQAFHHLAPTNLLMYEIAQWGSENGFESFHMGGGVGSKEDSLYQFKQGFNKNSKTHFSIGKKIFNEEVYNRLVEMRKIEEGFDESALFFPLYRV